MRKYGVIPFLVFMLVIAGCSSDIEKQPELNSLQLDNVQEVKLSRSLGFGKVNEANLGVFSEQADLDIIMDSIKTAKKINGELDIRRPDYDVTFLANSTNLNSIHLWLNTERDSGMYTYVSDTGTGYNLTEEAAKSLKRLIKNLPYLSEQAEQNGDVVNIHGKYLNLDKWNQFLTNVKSGKSDQVQVTTYTIEGDPIFYNFNYNGQSIEYTFDTTMDGYGSPSRASTFCERIESKNTDKGTEYTLAGCQSGNKDNTRTFWLVIPSS